MCHCPGILKLVEYFVDFTSVLYKLTSPPDVYRTMGLLGSLVGLVHDEATSIGKQLQLDVSFL